MKFLQKKQEQENGAQSERINKLLPEVNVYETTEGYVLEADMPGVRRDGLEVILEHNELTIVGHRAGHSFETVHYRETSDGDYRRVFELDPEIDTEKISARVDNGVLTLQLAKREQVKPRRIAVGG
jgi:HSP20 family protein